MIRLEATGLVYRNPKPYLRAVHAWHPSVALMDDGELVAAFDLGQAVESLDYRTYVSHSADSGAIALCIRVLCRRESALHKYAIGLRLNRSYNFVVMGQSRIVSRQENPRHDKQTKRLTPMARGT